MIEVGDRVIIIGGARKGRTGTVIAESVYGPEQLSVEVAPGEFYIESTGDLRLAPSRIERAAEAAWNVYARENRIGMSYSDLDDNAKFLWESLARATVNAFNQEN